jgi:hypothetical protein
MIPLLSLATIVLAHGNAVPHVHPHEAGLAVSLVLALIAGGVLAVLKRRKPAAS